MMAILTAGLAVLTAGGLDDPRAAIVAAPAISALMLVATAIVAGTQGALLAAGPRPSVRRLVRAAAVAAFLPLALLMPLVAITLAIAVIARFPKRRAANDNLPVALGLTG